MRRYGIYGDWSEGRNTVSYCTTPGTTSYGYLIDFDGTIYELAGDWLAAWHATYLNRRSRSTAFAQANAGDPLTDAQVKSFRWLCQKQAREGLVPLRRAATENDAGWIEHKDSAQGRAWGKSDVGTLDWGRVI